MKGSSAKCSQVTAKPFEGRGRPSTLELTGARGSVPLASLCCTHSQTGTALVGAERSCSPPLGTCDAIMGCISPLSWWQSLRHGHSHPAAGGSSWQINPALRHWVISITYFWDPPPPLSSGVWKEQDAGSPVPGSSFYKQGRGFAKHPPPSFNTVCFGKGKRTKSD